MRPSVTLSKCGPHTSLSCRIEHLDPPILEDFAPTVLGTYRPRVLVVTTPNAEFNVHFAQLQLENRLRHPDHRFEWTRTEFERWYGAGGGDVHRLERY